MLDQSSGVALRTGANPLGIAVAATVAAGAAKAMRLAFDPEHRLTAIVAEATKNVVDHAYAGRAPGQIELRIAPLDAVDGDASVGTGEVVVSVRDTGRGYPLVPTSADPPGLGLSMIYELSDELTIRSLKDAGTAIDAALHLDAKRDRPARRELTYSSPSAGSVEDGRSTLDFGHPSFLAPILPRAVAAHAVALEGSIDAVGEAMVHGEAVARRLATGPEPPQVDIGQSSAGDYLEVRIGPLAGARANALVKDLEPDLRPHATVRSAPAGVADSMGKAHVIIEFPLHIPLSES